MGWGRRGQDGSGCPQGVGRAAPRAGGGGGEDPTPAASPMLHRHPADVGIARGSTIAATAGGFLPVSPSPSPNAGVTGGRRGRVARWRGGRAGLQRALWPCRPFMPLAGGLRAAPCSPSACRTSPCKPRASLVAIPLPLGFISSFILSALDTAVLCGGVEKEEKTTNPVQTPTPFLSLLSPAADVSSSSCSPVRPRYVDVFY